MDVHADPDDATLRRYLLGLLPETETAALEEAYFTRGEVLDRLRAVEHDLLDDYAAGRLDAADKDAFEGRYLASAPLRERVAAARALHGASSGKTVAASVEKRRMRWGIPLAMAAGLIAAALAFAIRSPRPGQVAAVSPPPTAPIVTAPPSTAVSGASGAPALRSVVLALSPILLRGQQRTAQVVIPEGTDEVELELDGDRSVLPPRASALGVAIETVESAEIWRGPARRADDARRPSLLATARVPAARLVGGDYLLTLSVDGNADTTLHRYFFRVAR